MTPQTTQYPTTATARAERVAPAVARCDLCRRPLRAGRVVAGPGETQFDSPSCRKTWIGTVKLKGLQNALRVARSRQKTKAISRAGDAYRHLGGRDWPLVERLLRSIL